MKSIMKKLYRIALLVLFLLIACESTSPSIPSINPDLNNDGTTVCSRDYYYPHIGTTYRSSYQIEAEDGEITSITYIQTWDIDGLSDEEIGSIFEFLGPIIRFEYEIDGDTLIRSSPVGATLPINDKSDEEIKEELSSAIEFLEFPTDLEYEVAEDVLIISGIHVETWDISNKSEDEIRELIESFGSPTRFEYEIDDKTLTRTSQSTLEGFKMMHGDLRLDTFVTRFEDDSDNRAYICE